MAEIKVAVDARGLDWTLALIAATRDAVTLLRDCQLKLSVSLRADDPLLERIETQLTAFDGLAKADPGGTGVTDAQIEAAARALCVADGRNPDSPFTAAGWPVIMEGREIPNWKVFVTQARIALEAVHP
jgi:hypothetical protein